MGILITEHQKAGAPTDFNELFEAYSYFLEEVDKLGLKKLPLSCPIKNFGNMKPALDRALTILRNASDREEQLACLEGLDYGLYGAYHASQYDGYKLVAKEMGIKPENEGDRLKYPFRDATQFFQAVTFTFNAEDFDYRKSLEFFYRSIGQQEWAFSLDTYKEIVQVIDENTAFLQGGASPEINKGLLLGVIALITTGPNALKKINDPAAEVKSLLKYIENMEENVRVKLVEYLGSLKNTHSQSIPTPAELEKIIDLLSKVDVEVGFNFKLNSVLSQLERYGDKIYLILDNIKQRKIMEAQSNNQITQLPLMPLLDIIARPPFQEKLIGNEYNQIQGIFESNPEGIEDMQRFVAMLSLLSDDLKDREALSNEILGLAGLARLPRDQRDLFFSIMGDVDISRSTSLPSLENIREILIAIKESPQEYNNREAILKLVQDVLPDTKIGKEPINESLVGLVGVFQDFFKDMNFNELIEKAITEDIVPNLPKLLQKSAAEILRNDTVAFRTAVNQFKDSLAIEPVDLGVALQKLKNLDDETAKLLDYKFAKIKVLPFVRGKILNLAGEEHQDKLGAFFERKTLMVLLKENLEARFKKNLNSSIKVLQTANEPFNKFLTDALGGIDDRKPIDNALKEYSDRFDIVNGFANGLIRIRNRNEADYRRVLALINSPANLPHFQIPKMLQMTQIMSYLLEQPNVSIESQLNIILNALETHKPSIETIQKSLEQVKLLVKSSESLGVEAYKALLKASCPFGKAA